LEPIREVVDGQQRLRTLIAYIAPQLLKDFKSDRDDFEVKRVHNRELAGKRFAQLPPNLKKRILDYEFSVHVLPSDTEDREVLQIFARMNSTGYKLNDQELRNAAYFGSFKTLIYELSYEQLNRWRTWKVFSETDIARMKEVEETSDMVATMLVGLHAKRQGLLDELYRRYDEEFPRRKEIARRFRGVMDQMDSAHGREIPGSPFSRKPLFNTLFTFHYDLAYGLGPTWKRAIPRPLPRGVREAVRRASDRIGRGQLSEELAKVLRGATGHLPSRRMRLEFLRELLTDVEG